jgi:hypothetical protein
MNYYTTVIEKMTTLFLNKEFNVAKRIINDVIKEVESCEDSKDVGFVKHICYTLLGLVAFEEENFNSARKYLIKSVTDLTSPVLRSFGPSVLLAYQLSCQGDRETVEEYLIKCKKIIIWYGVFRIYRWISSIKSGDKPDFGKYIYLHLAVNKKILKRLEDYVSLCPPHL